MESSAMRLGRKLGKVFGAEFIERSNINDQKLQQLIDQDHSIVSILELIQNHPNDQKLIDIGLKPDQIDLARTHISNINDEIANSWKPELNDFEIRSIFKIEFRLKPLIEINPYQYGYVDYIIANKPTSQAIYPQLFETVEWINVNDEMNRVLARAYATDQRLFPRPPKNTFRGSILKKADLKGLFKSALKQTINEYLEPNNEFLTKTPAGSGRTDIGLCRKQSHELLVPIELNIDTVQHLEKLNRYEKVAAYQVEDTVEVNRRNQLQSYMKDKKIKYGVLSTFKRTFIFEKFQDGTKPNGSPIFKLRMSRMFSEKEALSAILFVCIKALEYYTESLRSGERETRSNSSNRPNNYEEDADKEGDNHFSSPSKPTLQNSQYHQGVDIVYSTEELASFSSRQSLYKIVLDYEETGSYEPYSSGLSGLVFLGYATLKENKSERVRCAAKIADLPKFENNTGLGLCQEARVLNYLNKLGVTCVPKLLYAGFIDSNAYFTVITEFVENSYHFNLATLKSRRAGLLAAAINELHSVGVHHGDLDSRNVLFQTMPGQSERCVIIDFACSTLFTKSRQFEVLYANMLKQEPSSLFQEFRNEEKYLFVERKRARQPLEKLYSSFREWFQNRTIF